MNWRFACPSNSGALRRCSGARLITSLTASTTSPARRPPTFTTTITVHASYVPSLKLKRNRKSMIGTIVPRRFSTPLMYRGELGSGVTRVQPRISCTCWIGIP